MCDDTTKIIDATIPSEDVSTQIAETYGVNDVQISEYNTFLQEPHRPPSRGGNTKAWHSHTITYEGNRYSFWAQGSRQWVFKTDRVSFQWRFDKTGKYRNILFWTIKVVDKDSKPVVRGLRDRSKPVRTAPYRMDKAMKHSPQSFDFDKMMGNE